MFTIKEAQVCFLEVTATVCHGLMKWTESLSVYYYIP